MKLAEWFENNPQVFSEWDIKANTHIDPEVDGYTINQKAWWICEKGHRYESYVYTRTLSNGGCPYCAGLKALQGFNDLATVRPDVLKFWDFDKNTDISPTEITEFSHKKAWWKCEKGHSWSARIQSITYLEKGRNGCPYCNGKFAIPGENDLATLFPEIAKEWCYELNDTTPDRIQVASNKKYWWKCEKGHTWQAAPFNRTGKQKSNCPYCINYRVWTGYNDLATLFPNLMNEWCYDLNKDVDPTKISKSSRERVWWKCAEGHTWQALVYARTRDNGTGCPICSRRKK